MRSTLQAGLTAALALAGAAFGPVSAAQAQQPTAPPPLEAYGALPGLERVQVSPAGDRLAFITVNGEQRVLVLLDLATRAQVGGLDVGAAKVRDVDWVSEDQIMVTTSKTESLPRFGIAQIELFTSQIYDLNRNRILQVLKDTRGVFPGLFSSARVVRGDPPHVFVRAYAFENPERLDLFNVNLQNGRGELAEVMGRNVDAFVLGPDGTSQARAEYEPRFQTWSLYLRQGGAMRQTWSTAAPIDLPWLAGLGVSGDSVIVQADRDDLGQPESASDPFFDVNLATGEWKPVNFGFSPDGLMFHPVTRRLIGASRGDDSGAEYAFADPAATAMWLRIQQTFAGRSPSIVSWSDDYRQVVVATAGARDPGTYYVLDLDAGSAIRVGTSYEGIKADQVAPVRPIDYDAADGLSIHAYLTTPPGITDPKGLPLVVLPHGGPQSQDVMHFDWWAQALASRGYAVLQPNFRGSTGRGDAFVEAGYGEWGRKMQTDLSDGVRYLAAEGVIDPARVCIVGASYGGYAALAGPTLDPGVYRCAVSVAGVSDLRRMVDDEASNTSRRENNTTRYWNRFLGAERLGDRSLDERSPARLADRVDVPILLLHGRDDTVVPIEQSRLMEAALRRAGKSVEFIELPGEDHWLSRSETRQRMLTETLRFLQANNPAD